MAVTGLDLALATEPALLVLAGVTGMLGAASVDLGPFAPLEQPALAEVVTPERRNLAFARYSLSGGLFNAAGPDRDAWKLGHFGFRADWSRAGDDKPRGYGFEAYAQPGRRMGASRPRSPGS